MWLGRGGSAEVALHCLRAPRQVLVRIAQVKYHAFPNLERRVHKLLNDDVLPRAQKGAFKVRAVPPADIIQLVSTQ